MVVAVMSRMAMLVVAMLCVAWWSMDVVVGSRAPSVAPDFPEVCSYFYEALSCITVYCWPYF
jgi:hypothetical protein